MVVSVSKQTWLVFFLALAKDAESFSSSVGASHTRSLLLPLSSSSLNHNNLRRTSSSIFRSATSPNNGEIAAFNGESDNDEDYVFITPTEMYQGDPNDHRYSASDWLANVKSLPRSTILRAIQGPVVTVVVWSLVVSALHNIFRRFARTLLWADSMCISSKPHSFLVSALGLLLVFRTNSAYQRFAEGRKIWENILSISRNTSRLACLYEKDLGNEKKIRVFRLLGAFPYLLHHHIQPQCLDPTEFQDLKGTQFAMQLEECAIGDCEDEEAYEAEQKRIANTQKDGNILNYLSKKMRRRCRSLSSSSTTTSKQQRKEKKMKSLDKRTVLVREVACGQCMVDRRALPWCLLAPAALRKCADSVNRPLWICDRLSQELTGVRYSDNFTSRERLAFLSQIDKLSKCIGECERIHQTAVPLNYARHSLRSLTIWLFSLPFALVSEFGLLTAPVMGVIAWLLFGVYQIGCSIEDPFQGSLRLSILCDAIYRDVMYDADMGNKRDSAFHLESEIYEWDFLGPIEESKMLLKSKPPSQQTEPSASSSSKPLVNFHLDDIDENDNVEDRAFRPKPSQSAEPSPPSPLSPEDDPMQPRP